MPARLHSIELHGFKSFARPTKLVFGDCLTAIVGPNGAGKSNIVDALRWVLGEPSLRLLRARRVEDLIFAGTERRARAGMAQVTVVFNNEDGWLPVDFAEVALTRRVDREGRSEIFLNGRRVRLRDVKELLAQAGLAEGGYTFIGQGMVDQVLQLRPEERRRLLEEAAGIGLYRQRREEALRRLEVTRQNLARVEDLLAELEPRLARLERRVARMQEAQRVQEELAAALTRWYTLQWRHWTRAVAGARRRLEEARQKLDVARKQWRHLQQERAAHEAHLHSLREEQQALQRQLHQAEQDWEAALQEQARLQTTLQSLRERLLALEREEQEAQTRLTLTQSRLREVQAEEERLTQEQAEARARLEEARAQLQARKVQRDELRRELGRARRQWEDLRQRRTELEAQLRALERRRARLEEEARRLEGERATLRTRERQTREAWEAAQQHLTQREEAREAARARLKEAQSRVEDVDARRREAQEHLARLQAHWEEVRARWEVLEQAEARQMGYGQGARQVAQVARSEGVLVGLVAGLMTVNEDLEVALAAALGPWSDGVVVERLTPQVWEAARKAGEQVRLVVLATLQPRPRLPAPEDPDWLGWAADHVRVPPSLQSMVEWLLGRVGLVRDEAAARRLQERMPEETLWVTLQGQVFYPGGPVAAGHAQARALFRRTREREELRSRLETLQIQRQEAEEVLQVLTTRWDQAQEALEQAQVAFRQAEAQVEEARQAMDAARRDWDQARQTLALHEQRLQERREEAQALEDEATRLQFTLKDVRQELDEAEAQVQALEKRLRTLTLDDLLAEVAYWERQERSLRQQVEQAQARLAQARRALETATQTLQGAQARRQALQRESREVEDRLQAHALQVEAQARTVTRLREAWEPLVLRLREAEAQYEDLRAREWQARQAVREHERMHQEALMRLQRAQARRASLLRRMREERLLTPALPLEAGLRPLPGLLTQEEGEQMAEEVVLETLEEQVRILRQKWKRLGPVVPEILQEYEELHQRITFLRTQVADLRKAEADLMKLVDELDTLMERTFRRTFERVQKEFQALFTRLFGGGKARLVLVSNHHQGNEAAGVDIEVRLPGKRTQRLALLSGGERSLTAVALIFALLKVSPTPFCVLDEVDAMLDESNVGRYLEVLHEFSQDTQFILITHHQLTVQAAQVLYGITLDDDGASQVLSLKLEDVPQWLAQGERAAVP